MTRPIYGVIDLLLAISTGGTMVLAAITRDPLEVGMVVVGISSLTLTYYARRQADD